VRVLREDLIRGVHMEAHEARSHARLTCTLAMRARSKAQRLRAKIQRDHLARIGERRV